jgi:hypothetical protein
MKTYNCSMAIAAGVIATLGLLPVASVAHAAPPVGEAVAFPESGKYIADMSGSDGTTMAMAITVDGDNVAAFVTNGVNDEAYFSGTEQDGAIDLTSTYQDHMTAAFDGTAVKGTLTMNGVAQSFAAPPVSAPAGMYTATLGDTRASWVVRPDQSMTGTLDKMSRRDDELIGQILQEQQDFQDDVRQMRIDRQIEPAPSMMYGTWHVDMDGVPTTAVPATGAMTF